MTSTSQAQLAAVFLLVFPISGCVSTTANKSEPHSSAKSGEISCLPTTNHPICKASFASHPSGTLKNGLLSTGTTTLDGRSVTYTCYPGNSDRLQMRPCSW